MKKLLNLLVLLMAVLLVFSCASTATADAEPVEEEVAAEDAIVVTECVMPEGEILLLDNFEDGNFWYAVGDSWDEWGSHNLALTAELNSDWGTDGATSLECVYDVHAEGTSQQSCFCCDQLIEPNLSGAKYAVFDINNMEDFPVGLSCVTQATDAWAWNQTEVIYIAPGEHLAVFDISAFTGNEDVKRFTLQVVGENAGGTFLMDNVRIVK